MTSSRGNRPSSLPRARRRSNLRSYRHAIIDSSRPACDPRTSRSTSGTTTPACCRARTSSSSRPCCSGKSRSSCRRSTRPWSILRRATRPRMHARPHNTRTTTAPSRTQREGTCSCSRQATPLRRNNALRRRHPPVRTTSPRRNRPSARTYKRRRPRCSECRRPNSRPRRCRRRSSRSPRPSKSRSSRRPIDRPLPERRRRRPHKRGPPCSRRPQNTRRSPSPSPSRRNRPRGDRPPTEKRPCFQDACRAVAHAGNRAMRAANANSNTGDCTPQSRGEPHAYVSSYFVASSRTPSA